MDRRVATCFFFVDVSEQVRKSDKKAGMRRSKNKKTRKRVQNESEL